MENQETENKSVRQSGIELLRIILILMIIALHYFHGEKGGLFNNVDNNSFNYYASHIIESFCIISVNVFVLITGYFSIKKNYVKVSKVINLFAIAIFYGFVFLIFSVTVIKTDNSLMMNMKELYNTVCCNWFLDIYCILFLFIPFINKLLNSISQKQFKLLLLISIIVFNVVSIVNNIVLKDGGYGIINFIILYMIGAYISKYDVKPFLNKKIICISIITICTAITFVFSLYNLKAWDYSSIFNVIASVAMFLIFRNVKFESSIINKLSSYTFSVFIIHANRFITKFLYRDIFKSDEYWNNNMMVVNLIKSIFGIYIVCLVIEFLRRLLFGRIIDKNIGKIKFKIEVE